MAGDVSYSTTLVRIPSACDFLSVVVKGAIKGIVLYLYFDQLLFTAFVEARPDTDFRPTGRRVSRLHQSSGQVQPTETAVPVDPRQPVVRPAHPQRQSASPDGRCPFHLSISEPPNQFRL
jgi:hypothetical protein